METTHKYRDKQAGRTYTAREYAEQHAGGYCCKWHAVGDFCRLAGLAFDSGDRARGSFLLAVAVEIERGN